MDVIRRNLYRAALLGVVGVWMVGLFSVDNVAGQSCNIYKLGKCVEDFQHLAKDENFSIDFSPEGVKEGCSMVNTTLNCLEKELSPCKNIKLTFKGPLKGIRSFLNDVCQEGKSQEDLIEFALCAVAMGGTTQCEPHFQEISKVIKDTDFLKTDANTIKTFCCHYYESRDCFDNDAAEKCGREVYDKLRGYVDMSLENITKNICSKVGHGTCTKKQSEVYSESVNSDNSAPSTCLLSLSGMLIMMKVTNNIQNLIF